MATWEKPAREERHHHHHHQQQQRSRRTPSFSSTLLDAIYHSIDESQEQAPDRHSKKNKSFEVEEEIACVRRAIKVEKWMESHGGGSSRSSSARSTRSRHMNTDSSSSNDSSLFSSETEYSASKSTPKTGDMYMSTTPKQEGKLFTRTKSRAMRMYGDLKKVKQPISPGGKIANFLNSIFTPRNLKKQQQKAAMEEWSRQKSRSVKDPSPRSCLTTKNHHLPVPIQTPSSSSSSKSKRSVRFCPVSVILDEDCQPRGQKNTYSNAHNDPILTPMPKISSHFLKKNIDSFRVYEEKSNNRNQNKKKRFYEDESDDGESSCASSDLFELQNINGGCNGAHREELPVYGTTNLKVNQAIANGFGYVG